MKPSMSLFQASVNKFWFFECTTFMRGNSKWEWNFNSSYDYDSYEYFFCDFGMSIFIDSFLSLDSLLCWPMVCWSPCSQMSWQWLHLLNPIFFFFFLCSSSLFPSDFVVFVLFSWNWCWLDWWKMIVYCCCSHRRLCVLCSGFFTLCLYSHQSSICFEFIHSYYILMMK